MQRSGLALAVLALLYEAPLHPYRMQQLIKERGKDLVINVGQRSQLYKTIDRLLRGGLITVAEVERSTTRPDRTIYAITDGGREATVAWTAAMLADPRRDFPEFAAGLAHAAVLNPDQVSTALSARLAGLRAELAALDAADAPVLGILPRLLLIESEYLRAHLRTDIDWIDAVLADLRDGRLTWRLEEFETIAEKFTAAETE